MTASPYLRQPAKPRPKYLPGDVSIRADGIVRCLHLLWGNDHWIYLLEAV